MEDILLPAPSHRQDGPTSLIRKLSRTDGSRANRCAVCVGGAVSTDALQCRTSFRSFAHSTTLAQKTFPAS